MAHDVPPIPASLVENLAFTLGDDGARVWLEQAVVHAGELLRAWSLEPLEVLAGGSMSLCVRCRDGGGTQLVLKVPADIESGAMEIAALHAWAGNGAARVIRRDRTSSAMLMNYLGRVGDGDYGLEDVVDLAERLHSGDPDGHRFGTVEATSPGGSGTPPSGSVRSATSGISTTSRWRRSSSTSCSTPSVTRCSCTATCRRRT